MTNQDPWFHRRGAIARDGWETRVDASLPGIIAHQSALRGGERLDVPDFGDAPEQVEAGARSSAAGN